MRLNCTYSVLRKIALFCLLNFSLVRASAQISVTATAGTLGPTTYTTLNGAITAINAGTHQGIIKISVTASTTETAQSVLNYSGSGSASYTSITIKPAVGATPSIIGSIATAAILKLNGADNVTIDGSNTVGGSTQDLTIKNSSTSVATTANQQVIWIASQSATNGATNNVIKNCKITGAGSTITIAGIISGSGATLGNAALAANSNITIQNNTFSACQNGIYQSGYTTSPYDANWTITGNTFTNLGFRGLIMQDASTANIIGNSVTNVVGANAGVIQGIQLSGYFSGVNIADNQISDINNTAATYGTVGIYLDATSTASNVNVYNNYVSDVWSATGFNGVAAADNGYGICADLGGGYNIYFNTVNMETNQSTVAGANSITAAMCITNGVTTAASIKLENNLLVNTQTAGAADRVALLSRAANTVFASNDYNDYYSTQGNLADGAALYTTVGAIATGFGGNTHSITYNPAFVSATDLDLSPIAANEALDAGLTITTPAITSDIDSVTRVFPTIGAYEFCPAPVTGTPSVICTGSTTIYADVRTGGTWSSGTTTIATVNTGGVVAGIGAGGKLISYTIGTCSITRSVTVTAAPAAVTASITPSAVCAGSSFTLTGTATGASNYSWSGPLVYASTLQSPTIGSAVAGAGGTYTFTASVPGCSVTATASVTVTSAPTALSATISPVNVCSGGSFTLTGTATGATSYSWAGPPAYSSTSAASTITSATTGSSGTYTFTASTAGGCAATTTASVTVNAIPPAIVLSPSVTTVCNGSSVSLAAAGTVTPVWSPATNLYANAGLTIPYTGTAQNTVYVYPTTVSTTTVQVYTATATSGGGCSSYGTSTVTVYDATAAISGTTLICNGGTTAITFTGTPGGTVSYNINGGSTLSAPLGGTGTATVSTGILYANTTYSLLGIVTAFCSYSLTGTAIVTVGPPTSTIAGDSILCIGTSSILSNLPVGGTWSSGAASIATIDPVTGLLGGISSGSATVTYTAAGSGCLSTTTAIIEPLPAVFALTGGGASSYCSGGAGIDVGLSGSASGISYQLYNGSAAVGTAMAGTGSALDFGYQASAGTYTVIATNTTTSCTNNMSGSAIITISALPAVFNVTGGGTYCAGGTGFHVGLDGSASGINYQLYNGATAVGSPAAGTGSALDFGVYTIAGTYTVLATNTSTSCTNAMAGSAVIIVNPLPAVFSISGGGAISACSGSLGVDVALSGSATGISYQLYNSGTATGTAMAGTGSALDFGYQTVAGTYSVIATNTSTSCVNNMSGSTTVIINPLPGVYTVTGGGHYCSGSTGVDVALNGSATGITYQLYNGAATVGSPLAGTGAALDFGILTAAGTYTVLARNTTTGCTNTMYSGAVIIIDPLPGVYTVTGGGGYCSGGVGVPLGLSGSAFGISYQLYNGAAAVGMGVAGTGGAITFGDQLAAGEYTVVATNTTTSCISDMSLSATVVINPLPFIYPVTGGGSYCSGGAGYDLGLGGSVAGINYQLFNGATAVGSAVAGTGAPINFGVYTAGGVYTVLATDATTSCINDMSGDAVIVVNPLPHVYSVTGGGQYCTGGAGVLIELSGSEAGVNYQLFNGTAGDTTVGGSGGIISFGLQPAAGTYTVYATNATTGCVNNMLDSAVVIINPLIYDTITVTPGPVDTICTGATVTYIAATVGGGPAPAYAWSVNGATMSTASFFYTYTPLNGDIVSVNLTSSFPCAVPAVASYSTIVTVLPYGYPSVSISSLPVYSVCEGSPVTFTPAPVLGGNSPVYTWFVNGSIDSTGSTFTYDPVNYDIVSCILNSDYQCRLGDSATSNNLVMNVHNLFIPTVNIVAIPSTILSFGQTDTLIAKVTNGGADPVYQWYIDNTLVAGATTDTFINNVFTNNDSVSCLVTNSGTCAGIQTYNWVIINEYAVKVNQVTAPGSEIRLVPNPNNGTFTLNGTWAVADNEDATLVVTDLLGQVIYKGTVKTSQGKMNEQISLGNIPANGVYMLNLTKGDENKVFHFVIEQ